MWGAYYVIRGARIIAHVIRKPGAIMRVVLFACELLGIVTLFAIAFASCKHDHNSHANHNAPPHAQINTGVYYTGCITRDIYMYEHIYNVMQNASRDCALVRI